MASQSKQTTQPIPIKLRTTIFPSTEPQLQHQPVNQERDVEEQHLLIAKEAIESSRRESQRKRVAADSLHHALNQERKLRMECSDSYKKLHTKYGQTLTELHALSTKCLSLHQHLDESQGVISTMESTIRAHEEEKINTAQKQESALVNAADRIRAADWKMGELEKEKLGALQEHQAAIANATDQINAAEQKIYKLEREAEEMFTNAMADRQKIEELEEKCSRLAHRKRDSSQDDNWSPTATKRQRSEDHDVVSQEKDRPATRGRKRGMLKVSDSILVSV